MSAATHLVLLTRVPVPGRVKTRLMGELSGIRCAQLQRAFTLDAVERLAKVGLPLTVRYSDEAHDDVAALQGFLADVRKTWELGGAGAEPLTPGGERGARLSLEPQSKGDLGTRMASAIEDELVHGATRCLLTGSDLPLLDAGLLTSAIAAFENTALGAAREAYETENDHQGPDVVLGPTDDGGYWLVGLRRPFGELFSNKRYGSGSVLEEALATCKAHGRTAALGPATRDVDTPDDLCWLAGLVARGDPRVGRRTAQVVRSL